MWDWLPGPEVAVAWLNTSAVERAVAEAGKPLFGAPASVVARVHDKAFAHDVACREGLVPVCLRDCITVLDPHTLRDTATGGDALEQRARRLAGLGPGALHVEAALRQQRPRARRGRRRSDRPAPARGRPAPPGGATAAPLPSRGSSAPRTCRFSCSSSRGAASACWEVSRSRSTVRASIAGTAGQLDARGRVSSGSRFDEAARDAAVDRRPGGRLRGLRGALRRRRLRVPRTRWRGDTSAGGRAQCTLHARDDRALRGEARAAGRARAGRGRTGRAARLPLPAGGR